MKRREIQDALSARELDRACLLCSEAVLDFRHGRLMAEYLKQHSGGIEIIHL